MPDDLYLANSCTVVEDRATGDVVVSFLRDRMLLLPYIVTDLVDLCNWLAEREYIVSGRSHYDECLTWHYTRS
jgi:hypothetical protein